MAMFVVLILGIVVAVDVWRVGGIVLVCVAAAVGVVVRLGGDARPRSSVREGLRAALRLDHPNGCSAHRCRTT